MENQHKKNVKYVTTVITATIAVIALIVILINKENLNFSLNRTNDIGQTVPGLTPDAALLIFAVSYGVFMICCLLAQIPEPVKIKSKLMKLLIGTMPIELIIVLFLIASPLGLFVLYGSGLYESGFSSLTGESQFLWFCRLLAFAACVSCFFYIFSFIGNTLMIFWRQDVTTKKRLGWDASNDHQKQVNETMKDLPKL